MFKYFIGLTSTYPHSSNHSWVLAVTAILPKHIRETLTLRKKIKNKNKNKPILELLVANGTPKASTNEGGCGGKTQSEKEPPVEEVVRDMGLDGRGICR
jgi:hypothetical protein